MEKEKAQVLEKTLTGMNFSDLSKVAYLVIHKMIVATPGNRRLGCYQLGDIQLVYGRGKEWQEKLQMLYQGWMSSQLGPTPPEFELQRQMGVMVGAFFDSLNQNQLQLAIDYLTERLTQCQTMSDQSALPTPKSSLSEKLLEHRKSEKAYR